MTDFPERFSCLRHVMVARRMPVGVVCEPPLQYQIVRVRLASGFVFITFKGVTSREQADLLRGGEIQIAEEERVTLPEDHYFRHEIIGLNVYLEDVYLEGHILLGKVDSILETGGNDVYVVKKENREYLIPALKSVVKKIDIVKNEMIIRPMEGLLDL